MQTFHLTTLVELGISTGEQAKETERLRLLTRKTALEVSQIIASAMAQGINSFPDRANLPMGWVLKFSGGAGKWCLARNTSSNSYGYLTLLEDYATPELIYHFVADLQKGLVDEFSKYLEDRKAKSQSTKKSFQDLLAILEHHKQRM